MALHSRKGYLKELSKNTFLTIYRLIIASTTYKNKVHSLVSIERGTQHEEVSFKKLKA